MKILSLHEFGIVMVGPDKKRIPFYQKAHNWWYPKVGQRLWHISVFSAPLEKMPYFLRLAFTLGKNSLL